MVRKMEKKKLKRLCQGSSAILKKYLCPNCNISGCLEFVDTYTPGSGANMLIISSNLHNAIAIRCVRCDTLLEVPIELRQKDIDYECVYSINGLKKLRKNGKEI